MNKIALVISIVALALGGVSLYLYTKVDKPKAITRESNTTSDAGQFKMAYFEMDSLENNYEYVKEIRETLRKMDEDNKRELAALKTKFEKEMAGWNKNAASITQEQSEAMNNAYQRMSAIYSSKEKELYDKLAAEQQKKLMDVNKRIADFLQEYNKTKKYNYIITNEQSLIYYKDSVYNITKDVVEGLNAKHKAGKKN
ncbi:MAG TPA: OmpH family outer membrane protein [Chitinophagaceae bacterium]|nr:OmpH family outer membrane protein [Chitinophagaceae bacterium]